MEKQHKGISNKNDPQPEEEIDELYQYRALIEQLRTEKQDYFNESKHYYTLLKKIYDVYRNKLGLYADWPIESKKMSPSSIEKLFKLEDNKE